MKTKDEIIRTLRENVPKLASEYGVQRIALFGSYARGTAVEQSDIDLVVEFERPIGFRFVELADLLEDLLGSSVNLLTPAGIESIRVEEAARDIKKSLIEV